MQQINDILSNTPEMIFYIISYLLKFTKGIEVNFIVSMNILYALIIHIVNYDIDYTEYFNTIKLEYEQYKNTEHVTRLGIVLCTCMILHLAIILLCLIFFPTITIICLYVCGWFIFDFGYFYVRSLLNRN